MNKYKAISLTTPPAKILHDNKDEMKTIIECPNCGEPTEYGKTRMICGYVGCDNMIDDKKSCFFGDLRIRVLSYRDKPEGTKERQAYIDGKLYRRHMENKE